MSYQEMVQAEEKGRMMAARKMAEDPQARKRVEEVYGEDYCRRRYPEVYREQELNN